MEVVPRGKERGKGKGANNTSRGEKGQRERKKIREMADHRKDWCLNMDSELT